MTDVSWMLPVPVLLPLLGAGLALVLGRRARAQRLIALVALSATTAVAAVLAVAANAGPVVLDVGSWAAPIGVTLVADRLAATMLLVSQIVTLGVLVYSLSQSVIDDDPRTPVSIYFPTFLVLSAGVANAFLTGDLFTLYVGFEILLGASFVLITLGATRGRVRAGTVYVVVSLLSSALFLVGIALTYAATGTVNMAQLTERLPEIDPGASLMIQTVLLVAFGIKAAIFPLQAWLPDSYPTAPAPVTAVFAGLMTKVGVYALIRLQVLLFPGGRLTALLAAIGVATMIVGILGAVAQDDVKRLLSFTLVSHIGFMVWGLALVRTTGLAAAIYYAAHHILVQTTLFLIAGLIERRTGTTSLSRLSGLYRSAPVITLCFLVAGLNLVGVPPLTGFVGKLGLVRASVETGSPTAWTLLAAGMIASFLTLYAVVTWWNLAFWQSEEDSTTSLHAPVVRAGAPEAVRARAERQLARVRTAHASAAERSARAARASRTETELATSRNSWPMYGVVVALIGVQAAMAIASGPVWDYVSRAAVDLTARTPYVSAVLDEDGRGSGTSDDESGGTQSVEVDPNPQAVPRDDEQPASSEGAGRAGTGGRR
ncbi:Na+/H+ antiporter subunit D [Actinomyces sp. B33]|uniref:Na+/H+ antiporter subunit D n=1 Tax=Actinomyces sp. B33 TaxID=2942131 RepID=UPI002340E3D1|nr:Na+/H+ antiporter subunit D [Actinomyces sp. B33]MDC4233467.1 Na+/H+ antiporter subunit D [Actinomyces sp. B33]